MVLHNVKRRLCRSRKQEKNWWGRFRICWSMSIKLWKFVVLAIWDKSNQVLKWITLIFLRIGKVLENITSCVSLWRLVLFLLFLWSFACELKLTHSCVTLALWPDFFFLQCRLFIWFIYIFKQHIVDGELLLHLDVVHIYAMPHSKWE